MAKTTAEKIASKREQIQQLQNQEKQLIQKQKVEIRKARTKRLIERGAILESLIADADTYTNEQIKAILQKALAAKAPSAKSTPTTQAPASPALSGEGGVATGTG